MPEAGNATGKKIAVLCHFGWGMHRYRMDLLRKLKADGYLVTAIADWSDGAYEPMVRAEGIATETIPLTRSRLDAFADLRTLFRLIALYRRLDPDIAQHFNTRTMLLGALAARLTGVPKIINCVNGVGIVMGGTMRAWRALFLPLYWLAFGGRVQAVFQNTDDQKQLIAAGIVPRRAHLPHPGLRRGHRGTEAGSRHPAGRARRGDHGLAHGVEQRRARIRGRGGDSQTPLPAHPLLHPGGRTVRRLRHEQSRRRG